MYTLISTLFICLQTLCGSCCSCCQAKAEHPIMNQKQMTEAVNGFGFDVFKKTATSITAEADNSAGAGKQGKNVFISPSSLAMALAMTAGGAEGATLDCMLKTLGFETADKKQASSYFKKLAEDLSKADPDCAMEIANSIWFHNALTLKDSFTKDAATYYDAIATARDFNSPATVAEINRWCSDHTNGKIPTIVEKLDAGLVMALLNALYFKGSWAFDWSSTIKQDFTDYDAKVEKMDMMRCSSSFLYGEDDTFRMVELPYGNGSFVMDVILPKQEGCTGAEFDNAVTKMNGARWKALEASMDFGRVAVTLPKFTMEYDTELTEALSDLGMARAFTNAADFSGISNTPLKIGMVKQKTFVDVNEKGTEAAAVTMIGMKTTAVGPTVQTKVFIADRPFIFVLRECSTGAVLFVGQKVR